MHFQDVGSSFSLTSPMDVTARLAAGIIAEACRKAGGPDGAVIKAKKEAEDQYSAEVKKRSLLYSVQQGCTPSFFNDEGEQAKDAEKEQNA